MKLAIHSDLHLEGFTLPEDFLVNQDFDVLILAGDIVSSRTANKLEFFREFTDKPIIYVPGNHEYYRGEYLSTLKELEQKCKELNIKFCDQNIIQIAEYNFICCTGWSDLQAFPEFSMQQKIDEIQGISDFWVIEGHSVEKMLKMAKEDREFIQESLSALKGQKNVVVTHFSPTENHGNRRFKPSPISAYFSNAWEDIMYEYEPLAWIYGHTHGSEDMQVYNTKVFTNQKGYGSETPLYNPNFIVEI